MNNSAPYSQLFTTRRLKRAYLFVLPVILVILFTYYGFDGFNKLYSYPNQHILKFNWQYDKYPKTISSIYPSISIYPKNYDKHIPLKKLDSQGSQNSIQFDGSPVSVLTPEIVSMDYTNHSISVYTSLQRYRESKKDCDDINNVRDIEITGYHVLPDELLKMVDVLQNQLSNDESFQDLSEFFEGKIPHIVKKGVTRKHFYKFAGTSVWLSNHGVHLLISRVIFTRKGIKNDPQISLLYAQIYDENWKELTDVELVIPVVDHEGQRIYEQVKFPKFIPIPFYHNSDNIKKRWYGPEDTRLLLVKNKFGDDEPVIIFNAYHRQIEKITSEADSNLKTKFGFYRSMFVGWLWQYQLGKLNTDGLQDAKFDNVTYNKVKELRIEGQERKSIEKNWTPFVDVNERSISTEGKEKDVHLYIVYQWSNLKVLRCELDNFIDDSQSTCKLVHQGSSTAGEEEVGPIRGGTELVPLPHATRNLWVGFLRAHIKKCGCGGSVYRPNFLVIERIEDDFKLTYLSGSITFDIPVYGWANYDIVCAGHEANALIPNGISMFDTSQDYMTLTLSVADQDNTLIHIRGIKKLVNLLEHSWKGGKQDVANRQIECVVENAFETCKKYVDAHFKIGDSEAAIKKAEEDRRNKEKAEKEKAEKEKAEKEKAEKEKAEKEKAEKEKENEVKQNE